MKPFALSFEDIHMVIWQQPVFSPSHSGTQSETFRALGQFSARKLSQIKGNDEDLIYRRLTKVKNVQERK